MEELFTQLKDMLLQSGPKIGQEHWQFDAFGLEHVGYMERTYCYELYSKMREVQENKNYNSFTIHGEPEKARTDFFKSIIKRLENLRKKGESVIDFQKRAMPDFLVHIPYEVNGNVAIIEVKPEKGKATKGFEKDIRVIKEFIDGGDGVAGYYAGISLLYFTRQGLGDPKRVEEVYSESIRATLGEDAPKYKGKLILLYHPGAGEDFMELDWSNGI